MNKILSIMVFALALSLTACNNTSKKVENKDKVAETVSILTPEKVIAEGANLIGQDIEITGTVTHICKHGGKKCSIMGETPEAAIQVMAGENIGSFPAEVMGSNIIVKGTVQERQITKEFIAEKEAAAKEQADKAETEEGKMHCSHSMQNLNKMKQWMEDNQKEYYPVYFVQGESYKTAE